jgi:hypothetical protein
VGGRVPVLVDGGIRRGTDALKALLRGANVVLIGRPYLYALAVAGADGVGRCLSLLIEELRLAQWPWWERLASRILAAIWNGLRLRATPLPRFALISFGLALLPMNLSFSEAENNEVEVRRTNRDFRLERSFRRWMEHLTATSIKMLRHVNRFE